MRVRRRTLAALCTTVPLVLAATACSDSSAGLVTGTSVGGRFTQNVSDPTHGRCHAFAARGVNAVTNTTGVDIRLHKGPGCTDPKGLASVYLPTTFSANTAGTVGLWRSFSTVGWPPPVRAN
jgi:hypothetical protein